MATAMRFLTWVCSEALFHLGWALMLRKIRDWRRQQDGRM